MGAEFRKACKEKYILGFSYDREIENCADWWPAKLEASKKEMVEEIIADLNLLNPNKKDMKFEDIIKVLQALKK